MPTTMLDHDECYREGDLRLELAQVVRVLSARGWTPATSSNFSVRLSSDWFLISESGVDKELFSPEHLLKVALDGRGVAGETRRRSAETLLHAEVYRWDEAGAVLHTHSANATVSSRLFARAGGLTLQGYELLKAFPNIEGHDARIRLPIFENSQDMALLSGKVGAWLREEREAPRAPGFLLAGHGLYAWGKTLRDAKRHLEAFETLLECELQLLSASSFGGAGCEPID